MEYTNINEIQRLVLEIKTIYKIIDKKIMICLKYELFIQIQNNVKISNKLFLKKSFLGSL